MSDRSLIRRVARRLEVVYERIDQNFQESLDAIDKTPTCAKGCNYCCHQVAICSLAEGFLIVAHLHETHQEVTLKIKWDEMRRQVDILSNPRTNRNDWYLRQIPCVLLRNGECSIYDTRPQCCRTHVSLEDPSHCAPGHSDKIKSMDATPAEMLVHETMGVELDKIGLKNVMGPMPLMIAWATIGWNRGLDELKRLIQQTAWGQSEAHGVLSWIHPVEDSPLLKDRVVRTEMPDGSIRIEIK